MTVCDDDGVLRGQWTVDSGDRRSEEEERVRRCQVLDCAQGAKHTRRTNKMDFPLQYLVESSRILPEGYFYLDRGTREAMHDFCPPII